MPTSHPAPNESPTATTRGVPLVRPWFDIPKPVDWDPVAMERVSQKRQVKVRYLQAKYDGWRLTVLRRGTGGPLEANTRTLNIAAVLKGIPWFDHWEKALPPGSAIDCELVVPCMAASAVATALSNKEREGLRLKLIPVVFAVPWWAGCKVNDIRAVRSNGATGCINWDISRYYPECPVWAYTVEGIAASIHDGSLETVLRRTLRRAVEDHAERAPHLAVEGLVIKEHHYPLAHPDLTDGVAYTLGAPGWYKYKPVMTVDCVVTGVKEGKNRLMGTCGGLLVSLYGALDPDTGLTSLIEVAEVGSGLTDAMRDEIGMGDDVVGKVCEVQYQRLDSGGRLRHPVFLRWRDDKRSVECGIDQVPGLVERVYG